MSYSFRHSNRLLAALPDAEFQRLLPYLSPVTLAQRDTLWSPRKPIEAAYFPCTAMASISASVDGGGQPVEVAAIGNEGVVGLPLFLGSNTSPSSAFVQVPGEAIRMDAEVFRQESMHAGPLHRLLQLYAQAFVTQISQSTACTRLHRVEHRLARWLLTAQDRVGGAEFPMTHEFMAQILGVRRATITEVAGEFQANGLVRCRRGVVAILDRDGLRQVSCDCYRVVQEEFDRLLSPQVA
jgi:CRP-like cAMP-binding protein